MNIKWPIIILGIIIILIGGFFALNSYIYNEKQANFVVGETVSKSGQVLAVDLEQAALDGPIIITIESSNGEVSTIAVPSMGISLCPARENNNIGDAYLIKVGDMIDVRGEIGEDGSIVPCSSPDHYLRPQPIVVADFEGEADPSRMTLDMNTWNWISTLYNDGREILPKTPNEFSLTLSKDGNFTATTDCNSVGGKYTADKESLVFSEIFMTERYCQGSQESEFVSMLENTHFYHFTSRGELILDLKFDSGSVVFR
jgi:heat shock protein HslJ